MTDCVCLKQQKDANGSNYCPGDAKVLIPKIKFKAIYCKLLLYYPDLC